MHEPGLAEQLAQTEGRLSAITDVEAAIRDTDISFIVVSTPSEPSGGFSLRYVEPVCQAIGRALAAKASYHVVCLTSTVMPGTTGRCRARMLEKSSGKRVGADFGLCYSPEFIALGSVIRDFLNPDMLLIGESDPRAGDFLQSLYAQVCENKPALARMAFVNAEITKLAVNTYVTTKISYANMLARICEQLPGANVDVITSALGLDTRIGAKYLKGALSYGGPCFPRDNLALAQLAQQLGVPPGPGAGGRSLQPRTGFLARRSGAAAPDGTAGILGLTYKAGTDVVEEAAGFLLAKELVARGMKVLAFDPAYGNDSDGTATEKSVSPPSALECIQKSDVGDSRYLVAGVQWRSLPRNGRALVNEKPRTVIDCWRSVKFLAR